MSLGETEPFLWLQPERSYLYPSSHSKRSEESPNIRKGAKPPF